MFIDKLITKYPKLSSLASPIKEACDLLEQIFRNGNKLLIAGNGGSAADADHIAGELLKGFLLKRYYSHQELKKFPLLTDQESELLRLHLQQGLPAIPLTNFSSFMTAYINDEHPSLLFAQPVSVLGNKNDVFLGISTSGKSKNIIYAASVAKSKGMKVISLIGSETTRLSELSDVVISAPSTSTSDTQEYHLPIYHAICAELEQRFYGE